MVVRSAMRAGLICAVALVSVAGCSPAYLQQRGDEPQNAADVVRSADLRPRFPTPVRESDAAGAKAGGFTLFGSAEPSPRVEALAAADDAAPESPDGYTLNFDNSPVANVVKVVLGDILGLRYTIDARAQGAINLSSNRPIAKRDLLFVLESSLRANNLAMIKDAGGYRITALGEAGAFGATDRADSAEAGKPGYGMTVIPLHYVSGPTIVRLLEGFSTRPGAVRADPSGRLMLVVGASDERRMAMETVRQFDVDWMRGQSVGLFPIRNGNSTAIASELEKIMDSGEAGLGHGLVKIQDVAAQNAILVVAARPPLLAAAQRWTQRLDARNLSGAGVHVYKVRYGDAKQMAQLLNSMFGSSGATGESDANQLAPGAGAKQLSASDRLTGGRPQTPGNNSAAAGGGGFNNAAATGAGATGANSPFGGLQTAALNSAFASAGQGTENSVLPGVRITADTTNNSLLVYGSAEHFRVVERALQQIDRPKAQVAIDVTIAEVALNDQLNYGVQFYLANHINMASAGLTGTGQALTNADAPSGFNILIGHNATPHVIINALHQLTDVKILSNPSLMVLDNQEATLEVGDQVPVSTGSATVLSANNAVVNTIDYKNTGIILDVIPRVSPDNTIQLSISQEISNVVDNSVASGGANSTSPTPTISERKVKSEITVTSGQMVMLAGLVADTQTKTRSGIPVFDQLPLVGGAFGSTGKQIQRTELIILIKPQIVRDGVDASRVAEQLRAKMRGGRIDAVAIPGALQINARP
ncbi:MAG: type II secretion system secretin GspD [Pseudomonadota bacterium]|nr:type II secretion system secretin GspD [Pseudomonadota bacterium]